MGQSDALTSGLFEGFNKGGSEREKETTRDNEIEDKVTREGGNEKGQINTVVCSKYLRCKTITMCKVMIKRELLPLLQPRNGRSICARGGTANVHHQHDN
jgi:hypothetical protein